MIWSKNTRFCVLPIEELGEEDIKLSVNGKLFDAEECADNCNQVNRLHNLDTDDFVTELDYMYSKWIDLTLDNIVRRKGHQAGGVKELKKRPEDG